MNFRPETPDSAHTSTTADTTTTTTSRPVETAIERLRDKAHPALTRLERIAWYLYDAATQPFSTCVLAVFVPILLEEMAFNAGTSNPNDRSKPPCADRSALPQGAAVPDCFVAFGGGYTTPVSYSLYITAISVAFQVVFFLSIGALADYGASRKKMLTAFTVANALLMIAFAALVRPTWYVGAGLLTIFANITFGCAIVCYNAYLPLLVDADQGVRDAKEALHGVEMKNFNDGTDTPAVVDLKDKLIEVQDAVGNEISSKGQMAGYAGGVIVLIILSVSLMIAKPKDIYVSQLCIAACGVWSLALYFATSFRWLHTRPGPKCPAKGLGMIAFSWKRTFKTFRNALKLPNTFLMLASWVFYSDAYSTMGSVAILFGKAELNLTSAQLIMIAIIAPLCAIPGNYAFLLLQRKLKLTSRVMVILIISLLLLIPIYGLVGFIPSAPIGFKSQIELYIMGGIYGALMGPLGSYSRVLFSELIPPGCESEYFALFEITDRGSSWMGPLLVGVFSSVFGKIRYGFIVLVLLFVVSLPFLFILDARKGKADAHAFKVEDIPLEDFVEVKFSNGKLVEDQVA